MTPPVCAVTIDGAEYARLMDEVQRLSPRELGFLVDESGVRRRLHFREGRLYCLSDNAFVPVFPLYHRTHLTLLGKWGVEVDRTPPVTGGGQI